MRRASSSLSLIGSSPDSVAAEAQAEARVEAAVVEQEEEEEGAAEAAHDGVERAQSSVPSRCHGE